MRKVIPKIIGKKTPTSKKEVIMVMGKCMRLIKKLFIFLGMFHYKGIYMSDK